MNLTHLQSEAETLKEHIWEYLDERELSEEMKKRVRGWTNTLLDAIDSLEDEE